MESYQNKGSTLAVQTLAESISISPKNASPNSLQATYTDRREINSTYLETTHSPEIIITCSTPDRFSTPDRLSLGKSLSSELDYLRIQVISLAKQVEHNTMTLKEKEERNSKLTLMFFERQQLREKSLIEEAACSCSKGCLIW